MPSGASAEAYADRIASALKWPSVQNAFDYDEWWLDTAKAIRAQL